MLEKKNKSNLFKITYNNCVKYGHRSSNLWGNENKNILKPHFNAECHKFGKKCHRAVDCWAKKKKKEDNIDKLFVGTIFCGEVSESSNKEDLDEWLGGSGV